MSLEVLLIAELAKESRAVLCRRWMDPIPVPSRVVDLQDEIEFKETSASHAFAVRCRLCECESIYAIGDIRNFNGEPRKRTSRAKIAGA